MNLNINRALVALGTAAALAAPAAATAKQGGKGKGHGPDRAATVEGPKTKTVIFKGSVAAVDGSTVTVDVTKGNSRGRRLADRRLVLDVSAAKLSVRDVNADGARDIADVTVGDRFVAQVQVARGASIDPAVAIATRRFVAISPEPVDEDEAGEDEAGEAPAAG